MEAITNAAGAVGRAVWGEKGADEEPQSGVQGDPSKGEPFDGGNIERNKDDSVPTAEKYSSVGPSDSTKGQSDVRNPLSPLTKPEGEDEANDVDGEGEGSKAAAVEIDGPGPRPIADVAKEHGGDAGNTGEDGCRETGKGDLGSAKEEDDEDGPQTKSHGEGTGEQYIKSSGLKADGGNFDASKAGAGREADRLLEQKGIRHEGNNQGGDVMGEEISPGPGQKEKKSLGQKIKDKLHRSSVS